MFMSEDICVEHGFSQFIMRLYICAFEICKCETFKWISKDFIRLIFSLETQMCSLKTPNLAPLEVEPFQMNGNEEYIQCIVLEIYLTFIKRWDFFRKTYLNRCFVLQNFGIARKSGNIFSAYCCWTKKYIQYAENMFPLFFAILKRLISIFMLCSQ